MAILTNQYDYGLSSKIETIKGLNDDEVSIEECSSIGLDIELKYFYYKMGDGDIKKEWFGRKKKNLDSLQRVADKLEQKYEIFDINENDKTMTISIQYPLRGIMDKINKSLFKF